MMAKRADITEILLDASAGKADAFDRLIPLVYTEMQRLAHHHLRREREGHTLNTTALVHEAYLKLVDQDRVTWNNRGHFFAVAAVSMRRILVNHARQRRRQKRGGDAPKLSLDALGIDVMSEGRAEEVVALDAALERLSDIHERAVRVVECRFFGGLTVEETAEALDVAPRTVKRDWRFAKAWLHRTLSTEC